MKKTVSVSIASTPFLIEEDAYRKLDAYLSEVKAHFAGAKEESEIVADIETRIAEQFLEAGEKVVSLKTVEAMIASMGDVRDFGEGGKQEEAPTSSAPPGDKPHEGTKRLYRNPDDKMIAGVASGLAAYLGIDKTLVRLVFVLLAVISGIGFPLYIILWIVLPEARTASQHLEMKGAPVTLENLADRVKERVEEIKKDEGLVQRIVSVPFMIISAVFSFLSKTVFPILGRVFGFLLIIWAILGFFAVSVGLGLVLLYGKSSYVEFPGSHNISTFALVCGSLAASIAIAILLFGLFFLGKQLAGKQPAPLSRSASRMLGIMWFCSSAVAIWAALVILVTVSDNNYPEYLKGTREIKTKPFTSIRAIEGAHVDFVESASASVQLEGRSLDMGQMRISVTDGILTIKPERRDRICFICDFQMPRAIVRGQHINRFEARSGSRLEATSVGSASGIEIVVSDGAHGTFEIQGGIVYGEVADGARLEMRGTATSAELWAARGSRLEAGDLRSDVVSVTAKDGSRVVIGETKTLYGNVYSGSRIEYSGNPVLTQKIESGGRIDQFLELPDIDTPPLLQSTAP